MKASYHHCPRKTCLELFLTQSFNGKHKFVKQLKGYKIPKLKFAQELEVLIIKDIVEKCGGNPEKVNDILNTG